MPHGAESVACASLENGEFGLVPPAGVVGAGDALAWLDAALATPHNRRAESTYPHVR